LPTPIYGTHGDDDFTPEKQGYTNSDDQAFITGRGDDTVTFYTGWGHDIIGDSEGSFFGGGYDTVILDSGIDKSNLGFVLPDNQEFFRQYYPTINNFEPGDLILVEYDSNGEVISTLFLNEFLTSNAWKYDEIEHEDEAIDIPEYIGNGLDDDGDGFIDESDTPVNGTSGADTLIATDDDDFILARVGDDLVIGTGLGDDNFGGGGGFDTISYAGTSTDVIIDLNNSEASDRNSADNSVGSDVILGFEGAIGGSGDDLIIGTTGRNTLSGGNGEDTISGGSNADILSGNQGDDILNGETGNDELYGGNGSDSLIGDDGSDLLRGGNGNDVLQGDAGHDQLQAGTGDDVIIGGSGNDRLTGGTGADSFVFDTGHGKDTITDFEDGLDMIDFSDASDISASDIQISTSGTSAIVTMSTDTGFEIEIENAAGDITLNDFLF